jgi:hypothetical protein
MTAKPLLTRTRALAAALLAVHAGLLACSATRHSPTIDEVGHLAAGLSHWQLGRFDLYRVNPPLVRSVAVVPVLVAQPKTDWSAYSDEPGARPEFDIGRDLIAANGARSFWFFTLARWACIPFSLLGGWVCFRWARELYGDWPGLLALALWCFEPNVLAHAQMITPDTGAAAFGLAAAYCFRRWLKEPGWLRAIAAGAVLGLALLTKTTWILLFALWPTLWLAWKLPERRGLPLRAWLKQAAQLGLTLLCGLYLLNLGYGFEGGLERLGSYPFVSESLGGPAVAEAGAGARGNRFDGSWLGELPVPVPRNYLLGIDVQKRDFEAHYWSYLRGEWRREGWWYYYLYALAVKVPLGVWGLALLAAGLGLARRGYAAGWREELFLLTPAAVVLALVSAETGFNHHLRYVLPVFPFAFVWMSKAARAFQRKERWAAVLTGGLAAWAVVSSLLVYPHSLSYFNEAAGGPANGGTHLVDSNIDWGQDLLYLKEWLDAHPEARPLHLAYFGFCDPRVAGIEFELPPTGPTTAEEVAGPKGRELGPKPGWYAVSVTLLHGYGFSLPSGRGGWVGAPRDGFTYFLRFRPVARAGWSIYIYHITPEECVKVRQDLGLPEGGSDGGP